MSNSNDDQQTHYDVLGLPHDATVPQINKQYRALRAELREMGVPLDDTHYEALRVAYRVLRDRKLRKRYDKELKKQRSYRKAKRISRQTPLDDLFEDAGLAINNELIDNNRQPYEAFPPLPLLPHIPDKVPFLD